MYGWASFWRRTGHFLLTSASCRHCTFLCTLSVEHTYLPGVMASLGFKGCCGSDGPTVDMILLDATLALRSPREILLSAATLSWWPLVITCSSLPAAWYPPINSSLSDQVRKGNSSIQQLKTKFWQAHKAPSHWAFSPVKSVANVKWPLKGPARVLCSFPCGYNKLRHCSQLVCRFLMASHYTI